MEQFDVYDINRVKTGVIKDKGTPLKDGEFRQVIHICIFNSKGEMLIQQRQSFKKAWPNLWDITLGGCGIAGETSSQTAQRELFEELGIMLDFSKIRPHLTVNFENGFDDYYFINLDLDAEKLKLQQEEVQAARWATKQDVQNLIDQNKFIPYVPSFVLSLFDLKQMYGVIYK